MNGWPCVTLKSIIVPQHRLCGTNRVFCHSFLLWISFLVHPTFRVMRQSRKTYSLSLKYSSSLKLYALRFMTLILLFIPSTLPVDIWQSYHASIPLLYASIPLLYIQGCKAPMHDIENCCSLLYICLWLFKYTKCSAVFFRSIQTLSLHFPDEP